jgi:pimeloyl-ACP methyl ester carboxylesterase
MKNLEREGEAYRWSINLPAIRNGYPDIIASVDSWDTFDGNALFVRGGKSDYLSEGDLPRIRALFPFADMVSLKNAGHWLHADQPNAFARITLDFLLQGR